MEKDRPHYNMALFESMQLVFILNGMLFMRGTLQENGSQRIFFNIFSEL